MTTAGGGAGKFGFFEYISATESLTDINPHVIQLASKCTNLKYLYVCQQVLKGFVLLLQNEHLYAIFRHVNLYNVTQCVLMSVVAGIGKFDGLKSEHSETTNCPNLQQSQTKKP